MFIRKLLRWIWLMLPAGFGYYLYSLLKSGNGASNKIIWIILGTLLVSKIIDYVVSDYYIASRARRAFFALSMQAFCFSMFPIIGDSINLSGNTITTLVLVSIGGLVITTIIGIHKANAEEDEDEEDDYEYDDDDDY